MKLHDKQVINRVVVEREEGDDWADFAVGARTIMRPERIVAEFLGAFPAEMKLGEVVISGRRVLQNGRLTAHLVHRYWAGAPIAVHDAINEAWRQLPTLAEATRSE